MSTKLDKYVSFKILINKVNIYRQSLLKILPFSNYSYNFLVYS